MFRVNYVARGDPYLSICLGRTGCAEASVIQDTLDACTEEHVAQARGVVREHLAQHGGCTHHSFGRRLILGVDLSGKRAGPQAEEITKGYFSGKREAKEKAPQAPPGTWGLKRWMQDVLGLPGRISPIGEGLQVTLSAAHPLSRCFLEAFTPLLRRSRLPLCLDQV